MANLPQKGNTQFVTEAMESLESIRAATHEASINNPFNSTWRNLVKNYDLALDLMKRAVKFRIPLNGEILVDMMEGKSVGQAVDDYLKEYKLPFPVITLECENNITSDHKDFVENNLEYTGTIIIAWEDNTEVLNPVINIMVLNKCREAKNKPYRWMMLPYLVEIDYNKTTIDCDWTQFVTPRGFDPAVPLHEFFNDTRSEISTLTQFMIALSCNNVSLKKGFPPSFTENKKRAKKGKPQLNQYYEILIETKLGQVKEINKRDSTVHGASGGTKSPHIRRGHIRHYEGKNVWIESTFVNAHKGQAAQKTYKVK